MRTEELDYDMCSDCIMAHVYGDFSALDYYHNNDTAHVRQCEIVQGLAREFAGPRFVGLDIPDTDSHLGRCDVCRHRLKISVWPCTATFHARINDEEIQALADAVVYDIETTDDADVPKSVYSLSDDDRIIDAVLDELEARGYW